MSESYLFRGLLKIPAYLSACPPSEILCRVHVRMGLVATADTREHFPSPVRLLAVTAGQAGHARPCRVLLENEGPDFLTDLEAPSSEVLPGPTADTPRRLKVADGFTGFDHQAFPGLSRKRYGFSCFAVEQLLDRCSVRFLQMSLPSAFRLPSRGLLQEGAQRLGRVSIRPRHPDVHPDITGNDISGQHGLHARELHTHPRHQPAFLPLPDFAGRPELPPTTQSILQSFMSLCRHGFARRWCNPVGVTRTPGFLNRGVTEHGEISRTVKRFTRGFLRREARIDNPACPLLRLIGDPAQARRTLRVTLGVRSLGVILRAVLQHVQAIPILAVPGLLRFAGVRFDLQRVGANDARRFHSLGVFQSGEWHLAQTRTLGFRGIHV